MALKLPGDFINRKAEQEIFDNLLQLNDHPRLLAIEDKKGTGKTSLLEMTQYKCKYTLEYPVSIIPLEDPTINNAFIFIERLRNRFGMDQTFTTFDELNQARVGRISSVFSPSPATLIGTVQAQGSVLGGSGNQQVGAQLNNYGTMNLNPNSPVSDWSLEQEELAKIKCIKAFFEDLKIISDRTPIIILIDSYERCNAELRSWIVDEFLRPLCFNLNQRPARLILVLAGRELPDFAALLKNRHKQLVRSSSLSGWEKEHVKEFLAVHGYGDLSDEDIDIIWKRVQNGFSIASALNLAQGLQG